jgi:hypothetical protein
LGIRSEIIYSSASITDETIGDLQNKKEPQQPTTDVIIAKMKSSAKNDLRQLRIG